MIFYVGGKELYYVFVSILSVVLFVWLMHKDNVFSRNIGHNIFFGFFATFIGLSVALIISVISFEIVDKVSHSEFQKVQENKIIALQDNGSLKGSFYLGSGYVDGSMSYVYMTENNEMMNMNTLEANSVSLSYSDSQPKVETYKSYRTNKVLRLLFSKNTSDDNRYVIYVPKGTIKQNFDVDLK